MKPRVLQVVLSLNPGGTERLVVELARSLRLDHGMAVCCLDDAGEWAMELTNCGVPVVSLKRSPGFVPQLGRQIAAVASKFGATVLHCHHYSPFVYGSMARWWRPMRMVFTEHGRTHDGPPSRKRQVANHVLGRLPSRIYAVSYDLRKHMVAEGFSASRIGVIYNGIDVRPASLPGQAVTARASLGLTADSLVVGAVGRLDPVKDLPTLVGGFQQLASTDARAHLVLIGDGPERADVERLVRHRGVEGRVTMTGYRADARDLLPALDVYVNTSVFEGVSLTILEAMASGLPVVATSVGGTPEVVVHGSTGLLIPPRDADAVAAALRQLSSDGRARAELGRNGRQRVQQRFALSRMVQEYAAAYEDVEAEQCVA